MTKCNTVKEIATKIADNGNENDYVRKPIGTDACHIDRSNGETVEESLIRLENMKLKYEDPFLMLLDKDGNELSRTVIVSTTHKHVYAEEIIKEATYSESGLKKYTCLCGDNHTEEIPILSDSENPTGSIRIDNKTYTTFDRNIVFDTYFNTSRNVSIEASDNESGVKEVKYYVANNIINESDLQALSWNNYESSFIIEPNGQYIIYAKITDNQDNTVYINTDGIVLDNVPPVLNLSDEGKYQEGTVLTIENGETLTVNGNVVSTPDNSYSFNDAGNYEISVSDKAGNISSISITIEHSYTETITKAATCTEDGIKTYTCACGDRYTEVIKATGSHNFVDGVCTVCGKKDTYELAPDDAYKDWQYTLDDTSKTIRLDKYIGKEEDTLIVYGNYVIDDATYKAKFKDDAEYMFYLGKMKTIKFSPDLDTSNVKKMGSMFSNCVSLTSIDLSNFSTSNSTDMSWMFSGCGSLTSLDLSNFNTSKVSTLQGMFDMCSNLSSINLTSFDTSNVVNMRNLFKMNNSMLSLDLSNFNTLNVVDMNGMFSYSKNLKTIYVSRDKWITSQANTDSMFYDCGTSEVTYK